MRLAMLMDLAAAVMVGMGSLLALMTDAAVAASQKESTGPGMSALLIVYALAVSVWAEGWRGVFLGHWRGCRLK